jgi:hypothetical protein
LLLVLFGYLLRASLCSVSSTCDVTLVSEARQLLYSRRSAAKALDVSVRMIDYAIASGLLETRHVNSRVLIPCESLANFAAADQLVSKDSRHEGLSSLKSAVFRPPDPTARREGTI